MEYIDSIQENSLNFVLCGYNNELIYHDYDISKDCLSAGKPLTNETAKSIFNFINDIDNINQYHFKSMIPKNILTYKTDEKYIIWSTPFKIQNIIYKEGIGVKTGNYYVPRLIWKLVNDKLFVYAIIKNIKSDKDELYHSPLFNSYQDGSMCMGNVKFTELSQDYSKIINKVESAFWNSTFTHSNHDNLLLMNFSEWCNDDKLNKSNCEDLLVKTKLTIKDIL